MSVFSQCVVSFILSFNNFQNLPLFWNTPTRQNKKSNPWTTAKTVHVKKQRNTTPFSPVLRFDIFYWNPTKMPVVAFMKVGTVGIPKPPKCQKKSFWLMDVDGVDPNHIKIFQDFQAKNGSCLNAESGNYRRYMNMILKKWLTFGVEVAPWKPTRPPPSHSFTPNGKSLKKSGDSELGNHHVLASILNLGSVTRN